MKIVKKLLRVCTLVLTLTLLLAVPAFAKNFGGAGGIGSGGDVGGGKTDKKDGFLNTKSGYIIYTSGADGVATSPIVAFTWDGYGVYSTTGAPIKENLATRFGQRATLDSSLSAAWGFAPCTNSGGQGAALKQWLLHTPYDGYEKGMDFVMARYLGMSDEQIFAWYADPDNRLNIESFMFGGYYLGSSASSFAGYVYCANVTGWANVADANHFGGTYTHQNLANSLVHDETMYPQFPAVPTAQGKHDSGTILAYGYGIVTVFPETGKQLVKVYKTNGVVDNTVYGFTSSPATIKDEGSYKVKKWSSSKNKTKATSNKADYDEVCAGCELKRNGSSPTTIELTADESAVFVLLEREDEPATPVLDEDSIRAHELNYIFTLADGIRDETAAPSSRLGNVESDFLFNEILEAKYRKETTDTIQGWHTDETFKVAEDVSGDSANSGREVHYYVGGTISAMTEYLPWTEMKEFSINTLINPHYSVNVSRVKWESNLHTVQYRDSGMNGYAESVLGITPALVGEITAADPGANVENTLPDTETDTYTYTAKIKEYWQERTKSESTYTDEDGEEQTKTTYGPWVDKEADISEEIITHDMTVKCDKYKVAVTPQANVASVGTILEDATSGTIIGHDAINKQIVATQLRGGTLSFYPEVPYTVWYTSDLVNYMKPESKKIYILGEYARKCIPPAIHGYVSWVEGGKLRGTTTLPSAGTGSIAEDVYDYYTDKGNFINGVVDMGSTFEVATTKHYKMVIGSVVFDCTDECDGVKSVWGNDWTDPAGSHAGYESGITSRLDQQLLMQFCNSNGSAKGTYYTLTADSKDMKVSEVEEQEVHLEWKEGVLQNKGEVIDAISWAFDGKADGASLYSKWGLDEMLDMMYISTTDGKKDNASGNDLSAASDIARANPWYDEESITMTIHFYRTYVTMGEMIGDDKIDYNMLQQSNINAYASKNTDAKNSLQVRFYKRFYLMGDEVTINADGYSFDHTSTIRCDYIENADFAVLPRTTSNQRK